MMSQNNPNNDPLEVRRYPVNHSEELSLFDLIAQLWKGKKIIIAGVVIAALFGAGYLAVATEKWTSEAIVSLPTTGMIANYNASLSVLYKQSPGDKTPLPDMQEQFFGRFSAALSALSVALKNQLQPQSLKITQVNAGSNNQLNVALTAESAEAAQKQLVQYITKINDAIVDSSSADLTLNLGVKTRELTSSLEAQKQVALDKKQQRLNAMKQALVVAQASNVKNSQLKQAGYLPDDMLYLLGADALQSMIQNESTKPLVLDDKYYDTQSALLEVTHLKIDLSHLQSFRFIAQADLPVRRDSPKKILVMLLAIILGGIAGSAVVIGRDLSMTYRQQVRK